MPSIPTFVTAIALTNFLVPLNSTMIVVALPTIARDMGVDRVTVAWLVTTYLIAMAALQPIAGRIGDLYGRRRLVLISLVAFALASLGAALATSLVVLVLFRVLQALAGGAIFPNSLALLREPDGTAGPSRAGLYFGINSAAGSLGAMIGPLVGGALAPIDWRWLFLVNLPLVALTLAFAWRSLPYVAPRRVARPDVVGAVSLGVLLAWPAWLLSTSGGGFDATRIALLVLMHVGFILFFRYERRHPDPALPPSLFRNWSFSAANLIIALSNLALYGTLIALPLAFATSAEGVARTAIALGAMSAGAVILSPVGGALVDRYGTRLPTAAGGAMIGAGLLIPVLLGGTHDLTALLLATPLVGAGTAFTFPATRIAAVDASPAHLAALASGVTSTSRYFGGILGSLLAALMVGRSDDLSSLPLLFSIFAAAGFASAVVAMTLPARAARHREAEAVAG
jgi:MFS family permease